MPDPEERARELEKQLERIVAEIKRLTELSDKLKEDVTSSKEVGTEIKDVLEKYTQALPNLIKELQEAKTYSDTKMRMILCAVEKKKPELDHKIAEYDRQIAEKKTALEHLKQRKTEAENNVKQAEDDKKEKEARYERWHGLQEDIEKKLQDIKDLKKQIETEDDASHSASMYFLALELQKTLHTIEIPTSENLKYKLLSTLSDLSKAKEVLRQRQSELSTATSAVDTAQTELDDLELKRRENILKIMATCDVPPPDQQKKAK